jgi:ubiquinone/menaquinone biosynthesis C-methylase UbiE
MVRHHERRGTRPGGDRGNRARPGGDPSSRLAVELEVLDGLAPLAIAEARRELSGLADLHERRPSEVSATLDGALEQLLRLRLVVAPYLVARFAGRRPTTMLGDVNFRALLAVVARVRALHSAGAFTSFRISAAGRDSTVFRRLREALAEATGLAYDADEGALLLRFRPVPDGWEALVRLGPRPLSARPWRVENMPGALNATIAAAMAELTEPAPGDRYLNLMCGSGTLLIERLARCPASRLVGVDTSSEALRLAERNIDAAGLPGGIELLRADATRLDGIEAGAFDRVTVDLPYGQLMGGRDVNPELYRAVLAEAHRVTEPDGMLVAITHDVRIFERLLARQSDWSLRQTIRVFQGGHRPLVAVLRRRSRR